MASCLTILRRASPPRRRSMLEWTRASKSVLQKQATTRAAAHQALELFSLDVLNIPSPLRTLLRILQRLPKQGMVKWACQKAMALYN